MPTAAEITKLSQRLWQPKQVATEVAKRLIGPESVPRILPETPNEILKMMLAEQDATRALEAGAGKPQSLSAMSLSGIPFPAPLAAIQTAVGRFPDSVSAIPAESPIPITPSLLTQLSRSNLLAHDRIMAIPAVARNQILAAGEPQNLTLFLHGEDSQPKLAATDRMNRQGPQEFAEVFQSTQSPDGAMSVVGRRLIGNEWYNFGTTASSTPNSPASTWVAPQRLLKSRNPAQEKDLSAQRVTGDVQRLVEGPWRPYLKGAGLAQKPHTFDMRHSDKDGIKSVLATLNTITGTLQTIQSATKGIQQGLEFLGMAGSLGQLGDYMSIFNAMKLPGSPGELITALITGKGIKPAKAAKPLTADQTGSGKNGVLVTKGGAAAAAMGDGMLAKAEAAKKKAKEEAAAKTYADSGGTHGHGKTTVRRPDRKPDYYTMGPDGRPIPVYEMHTGKDLAGAYKADKDGVFIVLNSDLPDYRKNEALAHELQHARDDYANRPQPGDSDFDERRGDPPLDGHIDDRNATEVSAQDREIEAIKANRDKYPSEEEYQKRLDEEEEKRDVLAGAVKPDDIDDLANIAAYGANKDPSGLSEKELRAADERERARQERDRQRAQKADEQLRHEAEQQERIDAERRKQEQQRWDQILEDAKNIGKPAHDKKPPVPPSGGQKPQANNGGFETFGFDDQ